MNTNVKNNLRLLLKNNGFRVTPGRLSLLGILNGAKRPLSVEDIMKKIKPAPDKVTIYRALKEFEGCKIVSRINLRDGRGAYEYRVGKAHHHHLICADCGITEPLCIS